MSRVFVVGGGASGMMAAIFAGRSGHKVTLFEKNNKLGKKLFITGKGRCNLTNACDYNSFFDNIITNSKFLYSAFSRFSNYDLMEFFESIGLPIKVERGNRVFPSSDKSSDVIKVLTEELRRLDVDIRYNTLVTDIIEKDGKFHAININSEDEELQGDAIIICTGGLSYPATGSTGDGYRFAKKLGHTVTDLYPSLVPLHVNESFVKELMGLSLKNVSISIKIGESEIYNDFGEMLFTHFGISGPIILSASSYITNYLDKGEKVTLYIDLKPALSEEQLDARILRDFNKAKNKEFKNSLSHLLPKKLIDVIIRLSLISPNKQVNSVTNEERKVLLKLIKNLPLEIIKTSDYKQAVITKGGVNVDEINPATMESKLVNNIYFTGEVLDLDGLTGGYNLQIAWSTAYIAGNNIG